MKPQQQDAHKTKKEMLVARGIIKEDPAENLRFQAVIPRGFSLNLCSHCNYRCTYCPQGLAPQPEAYIPTDMVRKLFCELGGRAVYVQISARGESLLHPDFFEIIHIIKAANADSFICLNTNGSLIGSQTASRLVASGIDQIQISLQTLDPAIYRKITGSAAHDHIVAAVTTLAGLIAACDRKPLLTAQFLDTPENSRHLTKFVDFCFRHGIHCHIQALHGWGGTFDAPPVSDPDRYPCPYLFLYPTINHKGMVAPCFIDFHGRYAYGSITRSGLAEIWQSERARQMREKHLKGQWEDIPICRNCRGYTLIPSGFYHHDGRVGYKHDPTEGDQ